MRKSEQTTSGEGWQPRSPESRARPSISGADVQVGGASATGASQSLDFVSSYWGARHVAPQVRESILSALYAERRELLRERRLGDESELLARLLGDVEHEIRLWMAPEVEEQNTADRSLWEQLEEIAGAIVDLKWRQ